MPRAPVVSWVGMLPANSVALKEWAVICHELAAGRQIVLLRKGGIREPSGGFALEHREFFLFPTYVHENTDEVVPRVRATLAEVATAAPPGGILRLHLYATVESVTGVENLESLRRLDGQHALAWPAVERRFHYRRPGLHVIALRVYRLPRALEVPSLFRYDGCRSWVMLDDELPVTGAVPVLSDDAFRPSLDALRQALGLAESRHRVAHESA